MIFPSLNLSKDECNGALRRLELETYSNLISVFRAQGCLNNEKYKILGEMRKLLFITEERHRAEARRAANDEHLSTIANMVSGPNSELQWLKEGRRLFPLLNRKAPLSSLTNVANSAAKYSLNKKIPEISKKPENKKINEEKSDENYLKQQTNFNTGILYREFQGNKNMDALKNLYALSKNSAPSSEPNKVVELVQNKICSSTNANILPKNDSKLDYTKIDTLRSTPNEKKQSENKIVINHIELDKLDQPNIPILEKGKFIVVNNEAPKAIGNVSLVGNILNIKRKSSEKISEIPEISQSKYGKTDIVKEQNVTVPVPENLVDQSKVNSNQSTVAVQKIINPFVIENVKVPANAIQLKDIQNRKAVKLITAANGKIFIQPAQGNSNRIANIRPITTVIKPNQCIALKKVTSLGPVTEIQPPIKISKANMIILPKTALNQKQSEVENIEIVTKNPNLTKFTVQPVTSQSSNTLTKIGSDQQNQTGNQGNVFVIGSVINQNIIPSEKNNDNSEKNKHDGNNENDLITEDTPVDIIPSPIEEIYKTESLKIITATPIDANMSETLDISDNSQVISSEQNLNVYSTTDWELELDQEAAQRHKESRNSEEDNFDSVIEEIVEEATEIDSFSEYEESCQYDEVSNS
ncbi:BRCA2-interacting transcriptional repressor EMSY-like isoform X1 [Condylostylus longicornis]|uniref:BRCA2-interacting transcriptional repressor EMSY-like isoform X1 n=1 Tax=Condylostylus longicornis TaxID=2530218 RepID=UPI00244E1EC6|nr:BRCA2-interacting transcriptional repressor EMSY-like isoform X1 [Condylostylus longicornis]